MSKGSPNRRRAAAKAQARLLRQSDIRDRLAERGIELPEGAHPTHHHSLQPLSDRPAAGSLIGYVCRGCAALFDPKGHTLTVKLGQGMNAARSKKYRRVAAAAHAWIESQKSADLYRVSQQHEGTQHEDRPTDRAELEAVEGSGNHP